MDITVDTAQPTPYMTLVGRFDAFETDAFRTSLDDLIANGDATVSVDLNEVQFIDSTALAELVRAMKHCREAAG